jgi:hypothetical protein
MKTYKVGQLFYGDILFLPTENFKVGGLREVWTYLGKQI